MRSFWYLSLCLTVMVSRAQGPEKIYGKNKRLMPNAYYVEQIDQWRKVLNSQPENADAWYNYYRASRNAYIVGDEQETKESRGNGRFARLQQIVDSMAVWVPDTFEYHHVRWMNGHGNTDLFPALQRAHELAPQRPEPYLELVAYHEFQGNDSLRKAYCATYVELNDYSPGLLAYGRNLLSGLAPNAILLPLGDKDTEAVWLLQGAYGIRPDVQMINLGMLLNKEYRERLFRVLGIAPLPNDPLTTDAAFSWYQENIITHIASNSVGRPVEVSLSVDGAYIASVMPALYITGLSFRYSPKPFDEGPILSENFEQHYQLETLLDPVLPDISEGNVRQFNGNYLPSLQALCDHLLKVGEVDKEKRYRALGIHIRQELELEMERQANHLN